MIKKTIVIAGQQGERGDKAEEYSVPIDGVLGYTETGTPDGYVEAGYFKVTGLDEVDSRIDVIESLPEGSTSGDAEVADIRVGVDGEIYDSAGIAVRDQITELHDYAESIDDVQDAQIDTLKVTKAVEGEYITIDDAASIPAESYQIDLSPVQSLNGYDSPWAAGAGKNKFHPTVSSQTKNGVTFTFNDDGTVLANGTATDYIQFVIAPGYSLPDGEYLISSGVQTSGTTYFFCSNYASGKRDYDSGTFTISGNTINPCIYIVNGVHLDNVLFKPMIRLATETDPTFAPYSNICPIHGADEVGVRVCGKNIFDKSQTPYITGRYLGGNTVGNAIRTEGNANYNIYRMLISPNSYYTFGIIKANTPEYVFTDENDKVLLAAANQGGTDGRTITAQAPNNAKWLLLSVGVAGTYKCDDVLQVEAGQTATTYEAYTEHSTTITLPSTVYGGSVEQGGSGESEIALVNDSVITNITEGVDGNADWLNVKFTTSVSLLYPGTAEAREILAAKSKSNYSGFWVYQNVNGQIHFYSDRNAIYAFYPKSVFPTLADFTTYYASNKAEFAIPLATPTDISVTPFPQTLLDGVNNVWAECSEDGAVIGNAEQDLTYQRDTTLVIQNLINRIVELERRN